MRRTKAVLMLGVVLTACGQASSSPSTPPPPPDDVLFVPTGSGLDVLSAANGEQVASAPGGVASPDFSTLVSTEPHDGSTLVSWMDAGGAELTRTVVPGEVSARVVSPDATVAALTEGAHGSSPYVAEPRSRTRVVVVNDRGDVRDLDLGGNFEPEAFSTDGSTLFLLEYIPAEAPTRYRVRQLLLDKEIVLPIGRLKTAAPDQMQGTGRAQVQSRFGGELYTLYTQQSSAGHDTGAFAGQHAFVHLLNLADSWTHCIDLPHTFGHGNATASALALTPDETHLFVVDWTSGVVADAEPARRKVVRSNHVSFGSPDEQTFAQATSSRLYVAGGSEIVVLDNDSLEVVDRWPMGSEITGLALTDDGSLLYVSQDAGITALDSATGDEAHHVETPPRASGLVHAQTAS